jgi:hypothetical protein
MRYEYKDTTFYTTTAITLQAAYGIGKHVIKPAILDVLSARGSQAVTAVGRTVMSNLLRPPSEPANLTTNQTAAPTATFEPIAMPPSALHLLEDLPPEMHETLGAQEQLREDLVA